MSVPYREGPVRKVMSAMVFREEPLAEVRPTDPCVDLTPMALPFWTCCLSSSATSLLPPEI